MNRTLGIVAAAGERARCAKSGAARAKGPTHAVEEGMRETLGRQLGGQSSAATAAALAGRSVARGSSCCRCGGAFEQLRKPFHARGAVAVLLRVAQERRWQDALIAQLSRKGAQRHGGLDAPQQSLQCIAFAVLNALGEPHLFLVGENAPARTAGCEDRGGGRSASWRGGRPLPR